MASKPIELFNVMLILVVSVVNIYVITKDDVIGVIKVLAVVGEIITILRVQKRLPR